MLVKAHDEGYRHCASKIIKDLDYDLRGVPLADRSPTRGVVPSVLFKANMKAWQTCHKVLYTETLFLKDDSILPNNITLEMDLLRAELYYLRGILNALDDVTDNITGRVREYRLWKQGDEEELTLFAPPEIIRCPRCNGQLQGNANNYKLLIECLGNCKWCFQVELGSNTRIALRRAYENSY